MASSSNNLLIPCLLLLSATLLATVSSQDMYPFNCSTRINTCNANLYHIIYANQSLLDIASFYSVNSSQIRPVYHENKQDCLISAPCSCQTINGTTGYLYNTVYTVQPNDTFLNISTSLYSGQVWVVGDEQWRFVAGENFTINLVCGCQETNSQVVVTYTVQQNDTLTGIATMLSSTVSGIQSLNRNLVQNPNTIREGWVLYVPMYLNVAAPPSHSL